jgi:hypothetical protein
MTQALYAHMNNKTNKKSLVQAVYWASAFRSWIYALATAVVVV